MAHRPVAIAVQTFTVAPQRVYGAILDPAMIARFMFGPLLREEEILRIQNESRVDGAFSYKVRRGDTEIGVRSCSGGGVMMNCGCSSSAPASTPS